MMMPEDVKESLAKMGMEEGLPLAEITRRLQLDARLKRYNEKRVAALLSGYDLPPDEVDPEMEEYAQALLSGDVRPFLERGRLR